jgi:hypothetical protein
MSENPTKTETAQVVLEFPNAEDRARRLRLEVERLARLPTVEWMFYLGDSAAKHNIEPLVWMNPPFGPRNGIVPWLEKLFAHGNGVALAPDRTSAPWWQRFAPQAELILFVSPKIKFVAADGTPGSSPAQGTSLLAVGEQGCAALRRAATNGLGVLLVPQFTAQTSRAR